MSTKLKQKRTWCVEALCDGGRFRSFVVKAVNPFKAVDDLLGAACWKEVISIEIFRAVWFKYKNKGYQMIGRKGDLFAILDQKGTRDHKGRPINAEWLKGTGWVSENKMDFRMGANRDEGCEAQIETCNKDSGSTHVI